MLHGLSQMNSYSKFFIELQMKILKHVIWILESMEESGDVKSFGEEIHELCALAVKAKLPIVIKLKWDFARGILEEHKYLGWV